MGGWAFDVYCVGGHVGRMVGTDAEIGTYASSNEGIETEIVSKICSGAGIDLCVCRLEEEICTEVTGFLG